MAEIIGTVPSGIAVVEATAKVTKIIVRIWRETPYAPRKLESLAASLA
jgi:hypothetical protein